MQKCKQLIIYVNCIEFYAANAWTDKSEKLRIKFAFMWCKCINLSDSILRIKSIIFEKKMTCIFNYKNPLCQNATLSFNGMHLNIPWTEYHPLCRASRDVRHWSAGQVLLMRGRLGNPFNAWWRHQMKTFSALLALCAGNSPVTGEFPAQRPVTRSFHVFFDLRLNKRLNKQSWGWWFETPSRSLWRHCNGLAVTTRTALVEIFKTWFMIMAHILVYDVSIVTPLLICPRCTRI